jgi:photosystem II stability/assembly factor-like uncharacterized protein
MNRNYFLRRPLACLAFLSICASASAQPAPANFTSGMVWRNIGPFRGGRVSAVTGAIGQPGVYYMGLPMGGVWKTTSAGTTWFPVFDSIKDESSVGAIEAAPSDPNVIYAGMGDMIAGGGISRGNGIYKSTDAGATWRHLGLEKTEHIPSILVDPHNPNIVMVAAQGPNNAKSDARGLFRSTDGGLTWTKTLNVSDEIGVQRIARAFDHPEVMLATTMQYYSPPGQPRGGFGGGRGQGTPGTKLYKSTDEGLTWKELSGGGLPALSGRTCVAIAMHTNAQRMFLVGNFGLFRSDDGGANWRQMDAADRRVANGQGGYNCGVYVNTKDPDIIYVINTCSYRSTDGGKTFTGFKGAPGGDDPQQMWLDPTDGNRLFFGTDQGATISHDGGQNWSSWYNQSTAQVYHISVDNQFPYWVYGTQQDSGSVATSSRGNLGAITPLDWLPHPGYEFGSIVADPLNPKVSYAGGPSGGIVKTTYPSGQWIDVSPSVDSSLALRKVGNQPLLFSPKDPRELLAGFQCVMATTDGGKRWRALSPDLTLKPGETPPNPSAPAAAAAVGQSPPDDEDEFGDDEEREAQRGGQGGAIESISVSSVDANVIWAGTNNGLVKLSRDHGTTWEDATIPDLPNGSRAVISALDASHQDPGAAYAAVDCHGAGDYKPYLYRTHDYGKTWTPIVNGLPNDQPGGSFTRVIRADTNRPGMLFAGTESSVYFSLDDGDHWQSLMLNLPATSYRDMVVKDSDLVVGTYGRGFWILDDISPLRQIARTTLSEPAHLFKPAVATRVRRNVNGDTPFPPEVPHADNPPAGAIIYYYLGSKPSGEITLEVRDARGKVVRHMSSAPVAASTDPAPPIPDFWVEKPSPLPTAQGLNRMSWNLRLDSPAVFSRSYEINANPGQTPQSPEGPLALPGVYTLALTVDGRAFTQQLTVKNDPRSPASAAALREQHDFQMSLYKCTQEAWDSYHKVAGIRSSIASLLKANPPAEVATAAKALDEKLAAVGGSTGFGRRFGGGGFPGASGAPRQPTFAALNGQAVRHLNTLDSGDMAPNQAMRKACAATCAELQTAMKSWELLKTKDLAAFNALLGKNGLKAIADVKEPPRSARAR